jgi:N-acetylglucosaminyldiphosphoundecaprenol N-acetyl-beta-D-mannosaminyltransferase
VLNKVGKKAIINFSVTTGKYQLFIDQITELAKQKLSTAVYFANVHMYIEAYKNESFLQQINKADIVTPDGQPLVWMFKLLYGIKQDRVAGMDVLPDLLKRMEKENLPVYFYGGTQEMLDKTEIYLQQTYPALIVAGLYSPPFRLLTNEEENEIVIKINAASPAIVFVFLGCPQQEKWVAGMKGKINAVMAAIGGALPVMIGLQKRAPVWMRKMGLEWLFRLYMEPVRLFKRYAVTNSLFIWIMLKELIKIRIINPLKPSKKFLK